MECGKARNFSETFLVAFENRESFDPRWDDARPWLFGIATNLLRRHHRTEARRIKAFAKAAGRRAYDDGPDRVAERLDAAAATAGIAAALGPGQYLRIKSTNVWSSASSVADGSTYQWLDTEKFDMYIPANRADEWAWQRSGRVPTTFFDANSKEYVEKNSDYLPHPELLRAPNGAFYGSPGGWLATDMSTFPRDPYRLLNSIYKQTLGKGQSVDGEALVFIADLLRTGVVPADLRAALYKAAAMIPGVTITEGQANLDGRTGVAIGRLEEGPSKTRQEIIIEPETGQLIGERAVLTQPQGAIPAGTATTWTAIDTSVSRTAP